MPDAARQDQIVDMVTYLRDTIEEIDHAVAELQRRRTGLAVRLAAIQAATDPTLQAAADDYSQRITENRPYENAQPAEEIITEAHRRLKP